MGAKPGRRAGVDGQVSRQRGMARNHASRPAAPSATKIARQPKPAAMAAPSIGERGDEGQHGAEQAIDGAAFRPVGINIAHGGEHGHQRGRGAQRL